MITDVVTGLLCDAVPPLVSVAIETYLMGDGVEGLAPTIGALERQTYERDAIEVVVAVDAADGALAARVFETWPRVRVVPVEEPTYYGMKRALAAAASGEIVAYVDSDCVPSDEWVERCERNVRGAPVSAGRTHYPDGLPFSKTLTLVDFGVASPGADGSANFFSSNNVAFRRSTLEETGFDPRIGRAAADYLLSRRLRAAGVRIAYDPDQTAVHHHPGLGGAAVNRLRAGFNAVYLRDLDPEGVLPETRLARFGPLFPLALWASRVVDDARRLARNRRMLGVPAGRIPLHVAALGVLRAGDLAGAAATAVRPRWLAERFGW